MNFRTTWLVFFITLFGTLFLTNIVVGTESILVIVNKSVPVDHLEDKTVSEIYKAEKSKWSNDDKITVTMHKKGLAHETFVKKIVGTTNKSLLRIWRKVIFTGMGNPPKIYVNQEEVVEFVTHTKGAIGYISNSTPHQGVKVVSVR